MQHTSKATSAQHGSLVSAAGALLAAAALGILTGCVQPTERAPAAEAGIVVAPDSPAVEGGPVEPGDVAGGPPPGIVSVTYAEPLALGEGRNPPQESDARRRAWLDTLSLHLADRAAAALPEGERLEVTLTEVQRAGSFEPWRGPQAADLRVVRDIYPPRIELDFRRLAADGRVLQSGHRSLRDSAFMMHPAAYPSDPLRYEKALVDDWVRAEFGTRR